MAENKLLLAIQKRKKDDPSVSAKGISLASWHVSAFLRQLQEAAGSKSKLLQYQKAHSLKYDWPAIIKAAENKLIFQDDNAGIVKGIYANGEKFGEYAEAITPKSALDFDCILTTKSRDRDGDVLEPTGANIDRKMPLLLHHLPTEPVGKFVKLVSQDDTGVIIKNAIVGTSLGHDTAQMVEFGCFRVSHGFEPKEYEPLSLASSAYKDSALSAVLADDGDAGWHVKQYDVMEVSLVTIPSNPDAIITAMSKGKFHHAITKLWAGKMLEERPVVVQSGFESDKSHVINVTINNGPTHTKAKGRKEEDVEEEEDDVVLEEKEIEIPEEVAEEETEELAVEEKQEEVAMGGGLLDDIDADIKAFGKSKQLPQEAKDRVQMIRNMIAGMKQKLAGHGDAISKALKNQDVAGVGDIHQEMCSTLTNGLKRICCEMDQLATVEELSDEQRQQLTEMQSGATAAHDMFKSYHSSLKDSAVDGDATETEEEDELEGMETKEVVDPAYDDYAVSMMDQGQEPMSYEDWIAASEAQIEMELDHQEAMDRWGASHSPSHSVASKAVSVEEQDGQFIVVDESGQVVGGPYATQDEADAMFYELQSQEEGWLSSHSVGSSKDSSGPVYIWQQAGEWYADGGDGADVLYPSNPNYGVTYTPEEMAQEIFPGREIVREKPKAHSVGSADDVALKLIGLIADGKSHELRPDVATMLRKSLKGSGVYAPNFDGAGTAYLYRTEQREDGWYIIFTDDSGELPPEGPFPTEADAEASANWGNALYQGN